MKRRVIQRFVVFLLLGAIVNVAVAWGLALGVNVTAKQVGAKSVTISGSNWMAWTAESAGSVRLTSLNDDVGGKVVEFKQLPALWREFESYFFRGERFWWVDIRGWPSLSLWSESTPRASNVLRAPPVEVVRYGIPTNLPKQKGALRVLPLHPLWPGFAINTIFYAAILWLVFFVPGKLRRTLRRRRGLCPACAYPIGTSPVCTECGKPVRFSRGQP